MMAEQSAPAGAQGTEPAVGKRRGVWHLVKLGLALAIIWLLWYGGFIDLAPLRRVVGHGWLLATAGVLISGCVFVSSFRLYLLARGMAMTVSWPRCLSITYAGFFANIFLPGGTGGDAVRLAYLAACNPAGERVRVLAPVTLDRLLGLLGLLCVTGLALPLWLLGEARGPEFRLLAWLALGGMLLLLAGLVLGLVLLGPLQRRLRPWSSPTAGRFKRLAWQVLAAFAVYREQGRLLVICLGISCCNHVISLGSLVALAQAADLGGLVWLDYALVGAFTLVANAVPLTPGGLGVGEGVFARLCLLLAPGGAPAGYGSIFLAFRCLSVLLSLPGAGAHLWLLKKK